MFISLKLFSSISDKMSALHYDNNDSHLT